METLAPQQLPSLPKLSADIILEVFTHRSLQFSGKPINEDSEYGDNERLAILGKTILEAAVTDVFFSKKPLLRHSEIQVCIFFEAVSSITFTAIVS